jgi:lipoprotein-anchoring transpeptidase ErfK/SrfK
MKRTAILAISATALAVIACNTALAQSHRYRTPGAVVLSPDLTEPWILQLSKKPSPTGRYRVETYSGAAPVRPAARYQQNLAGVTPLQADPVRRQVRSNRTPLQTVAIAPEPQPQREPEFDPQYEMQMVEYSGGYAPGTVVIDTEARFLYLVEGNGMARRYGVGVGRPGFEWAGEHKVTRKAEWPDWNPPAEMIAREAAKGKIIPNHMAGGPENPLGARALYLGSSLYRIHGTNQPWSIGKAVSSGCIRMRNEDVIDLYERIGVGTRVIVS